MITGKVKTMFEDAEHTKAIFPRTKTSAISDENGVGLDAILDKVVVVEESLEDIQEISVNADTLGGQSPDYYAKASEVKALSNDYIVEQGTRDGWTYRKWKSGLMEMWGSISGNADVTMEWANVYRSTVQINKAYPISFVEVPNVTLGWETPAGNWHWVMANSQGFTTATPMYMLMSATSQSSVSYKINFHVNGKWK